MSWWMKASPRRGVNPHDPAFRLDRLTFEPLNGRILRVLMPWLDY
jgi:hypothetical protein